MQRVRTDAAHPDTGTHGDAHICARTDTHTYTNTSDVTGHMGETDETASAQEEGEVC